MTETTAAAKVVHTCNPANPGKPLPFGKRDPLGQCPRCAELDAGAEPRTLGWVESKRRQDEADAQTSAGIKAHFAPGGPHDQRECGPVCTAYDW